MAHLKISTAILITTMAFTAFSPSIAKADPPHWFYNNYDRYDAQAYDDEYYEPDGYVYYGPPPVVYGAPPPYYDEPYAEPRRSKTKRWIKRTKPLRRWIARQIRKSERNKRRRARQERYGTAPAANGNRQSLYDAWQNDARPPVAKRRTTTRIYAPKKRPARKLTTRQLAYVPLPRTKPYHLIPATKAPAVKKITLTGPEKTETFDTRPSWNARPARKAVEKVKEKTETAVKINDLPNILTPTPPKAKVKKPKAKATAKPKKSLPFKPIRIEVSKAGIPGEKPRSRQRLAANQLSCAKAKSIVSGFGFSDITARSCKGTVYDFNAKRDGKPYSVKVSSLSGELKGVKRIK